MINNRSVKFETCGNCVGIKFHIVREMYLGTRKKFEYLECTECGCLKPLNISADMTSYYPKEYFTLHQRTEGKLKYFLNRQRDKASMGEKTITDGILLKFLGLPTYIDKLINADVSFFDSRS